MRGLGLMATALTLAAAGTAGAQTDFERFELFNSCLPVDLFVDVSEDGIPFGLTEDRVRILAESRLRAARLYDDSAGPYVGVSFDASISPDERELAFSMRVRFYKQVLDLERFLRLVAADLDSMDAFSFSVLSIFSQTWETGRIGGVGERDGSFIMQGLSEMVDEFILEYLRVNEAACE